MKLYASFIHHTFRPIKYIRYAVDDSYPVSGKLRRRRFLSSYGRREAHALLVGSKLRRRCPLQEPRLCFFHLDTVPNGETWRTEIQVVGICCPVLNLRVTQNSSYRIVVQLFWSIILHSFHH